MAADKTNDGFSRLKSEITKLTAPTEVADLLQWLAGSEQGEAEGRDAGLEFLLATTYDEVVWGKKDGDRWMLSNSPDTLPAADLIDLRAFGPDGEVFVWRDAAGLRARRRTDTAGDELDVMEEQQLLWGTERDLERNAPPGFTALQDGDQGLRHTPPLALDDSYFDGDGHRPARLRLRHYIGRDAETGLARIVDSRLVGVERALPPREDQGGTAR